MRYDKVWYDNLEKPSFQPPASIFTPVWIILYSFIGMAFLLFVYAPIKTNESLGYMLFGIQLVLNLLWSPVFFGLHKLRAAYFICFTLTLFVFFMTVVYFQNSILAGILMVPYLLWLTFACILNYTIWQLNK